MNVSQSDQQYAVDITAAPRAVIGAAADLFFLLGRRVLGPEKIPTAQDNAWAAVCADRERAREREEIQRFLAEAASRQAATAARRASAKSSRQRGARAVRPASTPSVPMRALPAAGDRELAAAGR